MIFRHAHPPRSDDLLERRWTWYFDGSVTSTNWAVRRSGLGDGVRAVPAPRSPQPTRSAPLFLALRHAIISIVMAQEDVVQRSAVRLLPPVS